MKFYKTGQEITDTLSRQMHECFGVAAETKSLIEEQRNLGAADALGRAIDDLQLRPGQRIKGIYLIPQLLNNGEGWYECIIKGRHIQTRYGIEDAYNIITFGVENGKMEIWADRTYELQDGTLVEVEE